MKQNSSRRSSRQSEQKSPTPLLKTKLIETEDSATGSVGTGVYLRYFKSVGIPFTISILIFNAINQFMSVLSNGKNSLSLKFKVGLIIVLLFSLADKMVNRS